MKLPSFDRGLVRTVLFSVAVVAFIIGVYETLLTNDILRNYLFFMVSIICLLMYRRLKIDEQEATPVAPEPKRKIAKPKSKGRR
ncbi:hypothetical protein [Solirubrum puertoriconensis]|uniref:Uncharacterized protein n=1 Tax=Solirubrum puertoriconensis TaxID=1751427 RepID=A0A9X0L305_SOLP1|nr:hypothetical protein [Solirubrum puertoriconensis]KUG05990.1 hypothetical protein ASU33_01040 [Solirubrum puertoriconensis]